MENLLNFVENYKMLRNLKEVYDYMNREEAVLIEVREEFLTVTKNS